MEEYDDLAAGPNKDGSLNLSHNTWKMLPPEISSFSSRLLHLHMSNNQLTSVPKSIGALILLRTLDVSLNRIENIDDAIGKCIRLRHFNFANNCVENFPADIGNCIVMVRLFVASHLIYCTSCCSRHEKTQSPIIWNVIDPVASQEELIASDNLLTSLPREMLWMFVISVIDVRNNKLTTLPIELSRMVRDLGLAHSRLTFIVFLKKESYTKTTIAHHHRAVMRWQPTAQFGTRKHEKRYYSCPRVPRDAAEIQGRSQSLGDPTPRSPSAIRRASLRFNPGKCSHTGAGEGRCHFRVGKARSIPPLEGSVTDIYSTRLGQCGAIARHFEA